MIADRDLLKDSFCFKAVGTKICITLEVKNDSIRLDKLEVSKQFVVRYDFQLVFVAIKCDKAKFGDLFKFWRGFF